MRGGEISLWPLENFICALSWGTKKIKSRSDLASFAASLCLVCGGPDLLLGQHSRGER